MSTKPRPDSTICTVRASLLTYSIRASVTTGTICSWYAAAEPRMRTSPVTASSGTMTVAELPSSFTIVGWIATVPPLSTVRKITHVPTERLVPDSVIVSPGFAEATAPFAGVPIVAVPAMPVKPIA